MMINGIDRLLEDIVQERSQTVENEYGDLVQGYSELRTIRGRIRQLSADEVVASGKETGLSTHRLYTRELDVILQDRFLFRSRNYLVKAVNDVMNFRELMQVDLEVIE